MDQTQIAERNLLIQCASTIAAALLQGAEDWDDAVVAELAVTQACAICSAVDEIYSDQ